MIINQIQRYNINQFNQFNQFNQAFIYVPLQYFIGYNENVYPIMKPSININNTNNIIKHFEQELFDNSLKE